MRIYIAGPYSADTPAEVDANVQRAIDAGIAVIKKGHVPYIPHLSHWVDKRASELNQPITWDEWMEIDSVWLSACDALLYLAPSPGANRELAQALREDKQVFYSVDDMPDVREAIA